MAIIISLHDFINTFIIIILLYHTHTYIFLFYLHLFRGQILYELLNIVYIILFIFYIKFMYYNYNFMCMIIIFFIYFIYYLIFNFSFQFYMTLYQKPRIQSTIHIPSTCVYILRICLPFQTLQLKDSVLICIAISMSQWNF